jgi:dipeptide transport system permease protein
VLSRLIHGTRLSLVIGLVSVGLSLSGGVVWACSRLLPRRRRVHHHAADGHHAGPAQPAARGGGGGHPRAGLMNAMYAIAIVMLPHFVRLTRAAVIGELAKDYVTHRASPAPARRG